MKTFLKTFLKFIQSIFLQVILGIVAYISFHEADFNDKLIMGVICSVCIIMIVWLEINKKSKS